MQNKTIKFFISSTFKDFLKERNALQNFVFPRLKKLCQDKGFSFQPVDLRWGVTNELSDDNKTMEYCLNEVKRCSSDPKPNLLILFGQRYGWVPLPSYIESNVFDIIVEKIDNINFTKELFEKEKEEWNKEATKEKEEKKKKEFLNNIDEANKYTFKNFKLKDLLKEWYIQDLNDSNRKYYLKDKKNTPTLIWRFIEKILKTYIQKVDDTKEKNNYDIFHTSATEQEITLALQKQEVIESKNTIIYHRKFKNGTIDKDFIEENQKEKLEKLEEYLSDNKLCSSIKKDSIDLDIYKSLKDEYIPIETKSHEEKNYPKDIPEYLENFCESIYNEFKDRINTEISEYNKKFQTPFEIELEEQKRFLKSKYFYYIDERNERKVINDVKGRNDEIEKIVNFITDPKNKEQFYLLYGKSGTGKTSVMAKAVTEIQDKNSEYDIYYRFIGTTASSTYSRQVFESIYREIESKLPNNQNLPKAEFEIEEIKFKKQFKELLQRLDDIKVVIFLDAIDQFVDDNDLSILLDDLPKNIKIIFSVLYDENKTDNNDYTKYYEKLSNIKNFTKLDILDQSFNIEILKQLLEKDNRTLSTNKDNNQQNLVESFIEGQTPLCVKLTYEIVREWTSNDNIDGLKEELPSIDCENKEEKLIIKFFNNVIKKHYVNGELLNLTLGLISASKDGLSETELIDIISNEEKILKSYDKDQRYQQLNKLPDAIFSKMYYHIQDIFTEKLIDGEMLINPYHRVIDETIKKLNYIKEKKIFNILENKDLQEYHQKVYMHFSTYYENIDITVNTRFLNELPYQLINLRNYNLLENILFDYFFIIKKYKFAKGNNYKDELTTLEKVVSDKNLNLYLQLLPFIYKNNQKFSLDYKLIDYELYNLNSESTLFKFFKDKIDSYIKLLNNQTDNLIRIYKDLDNSNCKNNLLNFTSLNTSFLRKCLIKVNHIDKAIDWRMPTVRRTEIFYNNKLLEFDEVLWKVVNILISDCHKYLLFKTINKKFYLYSFELNKYFIFRFDNEIIFATIVDNIVKFKTIDNFVHEYNINEHLFNLSQMIHSDQEVDIAKCFLVCSGKNILTTSKNNHSLWSFQDFVLLNHFNTLNQGFYGSELKVEPESNIAIGNLEDSFDPDYYEFFINLCSGEYKYINLKRISVEYSNMKNDLLGCKTVKPKKKYQCFLNGNILKIFLNKKKYVSLYSQNGIISYDIYDKKICLLDANMNLLIFTIWNEPGKINKK